MASSNNNTGYGDIRAQLTPTLSTLYVRADGTSAMLGSATTNVSAVGSVVELGGRSTAAVQMLEGDIAEIVAVQGTLSSADMASLESYLKAKHAL